MLNVHLCLNWFSIFNLHEYHMDLAKHRKKLEKLNLTGKNRLKIFQQIICSEEGKESLGSASLVYNISTKRDKKIEKKSSLSFFMVLIL